MQQATGLFESLIKQSLIYLTVTQKTCPDSILVQIEELYRYGGPKRDFEDIVDIFSRLFRYFDTAIYVIDGLDELRDEGKIIVLNVFRNLFEQPGQQKLFISSRTEPHHNINMIHIIPNTKHIHVEQEKLEDIIYYIERRIAEKQRINRELTNDPCLIADIKSRLLSGSKGMFVAHSPRIKIGANYTGFYGFICKLKHCGIFASQKMTSRLSLTIFRKISVLHTNAVLRESNVTTIVVTHERSSDGSDVRVGRSISTN